MAALITGRTSLARHVSLDAVAFQASSLAGPPKSGFAITSAHPRIQGLPSHRRHASTFIARRRSPALAATSHTRKLSSARPQSSAKGPTARYDELVSTKVLRDDDHQRSIITLLQSLHDELKHYEPPNARAPLGHKHEESRGFVSVKLLEQIRGARGAIVQRSARHPNMSFSPSRVSHPSQFARFFGRGDDQSRAKRSEDETLEIPENVPKGLYLFGDVGTGKSMLMDLFYEQLPDNITHKRRIHFHQFMIDAHKRMHTFKALTHRPSGIVVGASSAIMSGLSAAGSEAASRASGDEVDPIPHVAMEFAQEATVLCFDEFQVTDIADAMILRRLLHHMIAHGVVLVTTSNRHPNDLYKNGIQRSSFIPCIELLKTRTTVKDLNSGTDYRKVPRSLSKVYYSSVEESSMREFEKLFGAFTSDPSDPELDNRELLVWGRKVKVPTSTTKVARFTFQELCGTPRSAADYIEICRTFPTIFIHDIPKMGLDQREVARRFITFIDAAYESKQKIFLSSEVPILQIFGAGDHGHKGAEASDAMREAMDALGMTIDQLGGNPIFSGDEELFAVSVEEETVALPESLC